MTTARRRPGYTLVAVLIVVVVLSLVAYRFTDAMTAEYQVAVRSSEAAEAKTLAVSGVHYAAGMLADPDSLNNRLGGNPYDNAIEFANVVVTDPSKPRGGGRFSLFAVADNGAGFADSRYEIKHGVTDEQAKLNVNALIALDSTGQVLYDALMMLPYMTEDVADAIVDWVDADDTTRTAGAETAYYTSLAFPYAAKNGPLNSLDELLLVRGVTSQLLYGNDRNRNGRPDPGEDDGNEFSRGWSEYLTVYGREIDVDTSGNPRIMINPSDPSADVTTLAADLTNALGQEMADYVLFYVLGGQVSQTSTTTSVTLSASGQTGQTGRLTLQLGGQRSLSSNNSNTVTGTADQLRAAVQQMIDEGKTPSKKLNSVFTLYNSRATLPQPQNQQGQGGQGQQQQQQPTIVYPSPLNDPAKLKDLLPKLLDLTTPRTTYEIAPRVNVNTAPPEVLLALPGMTQQDVDAIVSGRTGLDPTDPATTTGAWIVTEAGIPMDRFRNLEKYVTGRTMTYRVQSVGYFGQGGPVARVEAVIDTNQGHPRIVYFRDLTDLGRGFDLPR